LTEQQSVGDEQDVPAALHFSIFDAQVWVVPSQIPEQHVAP